MRLSLVGWGLYLGTSEGIQGHCSLTVEGNKGMGFRV